LFRLRVAALLLVTLVPFKPEAEGIFASEFGGVALASGTSCAAAQARLDQARNNLVAIQAQCHPANWDRPPMCDYHVDQAEREVVDATIEWLEACG